MITVVTRLSRLMFGLLLYAIGIVNTIYAGVGLSPWDVFHQGLTMHLPLTMGQASMCIGLMIVLLDWALGEKNWNRHTGQYVFYRAVYGFDHVQSLDAKSGWPYHAICSADDRHDDHWTSQLLLFECGLWLWTEGWPNGGPD